MPHYAARANRKTHRQTDRQTVVVTIHFALLCPMQRLEVVQRNCQVRKLSRDDAMVRGRWMFDEQEGCEWMDVSSGTGSPK